MLGELSLYAVASPYPGEEPALEKAQQSPEIAKNVRRFARRWLGMR
jgi:hypothetical protein